MVSKQRFVVWWWIGIVFIFSLPGIVEAKPFRVNARSALLMNMNDGRILYEQNADTRIPPASITKILTLYLVFDAIRAGRIHPSDTVLISTKAASSTGSRMHIRAGQVVPLEELIKGMAVVSGNDACISVAEYMSGSTEEFVRRMNQKARELGMENTHFANPNGLPADGQYTTARDIARLSVAYLQRFPDSLDIHSMRSYSFNKITHRNANRLLGTCPGTDGLKTGFVCAAGYNISATAKRGGVRLLAVVLGAPSAGVRAAEAKKLLEMGFQTVAPGSIPELRVVQQTNTDFPDNETSGETCAVGQPGSRSKLVKRIKVVRIAGSGKNVRSSKRVQAAKSSTISRSKSTKAKAVETTKTAKASVQPKTKPKTPLKVVQAGKKNAPVKQTTAVKSATVAKTTVKSTQQAQAAAKTRVTTKAETTKQAVAKKGSDVKPAVAVKNAKTATRPKETKKVGVAQANTKSTPSEKQKAVPAAPSKKSGTTQKPPQHAQNAKAKKG
jgi:D-alanyl-D-alanine carboxypeptidase (penicillin-binding protein 5/6)